jgi:flagellar biosynthesis anti-sigma factor FlgM
VYINNAEIHKVLEVHLHKVYDTKCKASTSATKGPDQLILSPKAAELQLAKQAISGVSDTRDDLVQSLKAKLQSGTYNVEERNIASNMFDLAIQNLRKV